MNFKQFLEEAKHRRDISVEKAKELLELNCKDALKHFDTPIWRGSKNTSEEAYLIKGEDGGRASANTENYYTIIFDEFLPKLGYPKRSESIICANNQNKDYAYGFSGRANGGVFAIFPYDGVKIGVCPRHDMWYTQVRINDASYELDRANQLFARMGLSDNSYDDFKNSIKDHMKSNILVRNTFGDDPNNIDEILKNAYSPDKLGFHLATTADIQKYEDKEREVWVSGSCIALRHDVWKQLREVY